jgi:regulator of protease activity HflC (stomatin/prohibitin superfamily)
MNHDLWMHMAGHPAPPTPVARGRRVSVHEWQRGVLFRDGRVTETLEPGSRRIWTARTSVRLVDLRPWIMSIPTQEVPTADGITVKVTVTAQVRVTDPVTHVTGVQDPRATLYLAVQVALREVVAATTLEALIGARSELATALGTALRVDDDLGVAVERVELRDIILPAELKRAQAQVLLARAEGQAALERARGETAALRSLANAARIAADNPMLYQLRLLQQLATSAGHTVVIGATAAVTPIPTAPDLPAEGRAAAPPAPPPAS